jgi:hypothetical protein
MPAIVVPETYMLIPTRARQHLVTQHALNALTCYKLNHINLTVTPTALLPSVVKNAPSHIEHFALPMVHPVTGETISSYQKMMHDPATAEIWQMAFGKDFGSIVQGDIKMEQKGTNAMFVMTHDEIKHVLWQEKKITYGNPEVNYRPQKEDPCRICITAGGNLVTYKSSLSVCTADLDTAKLCWKSVISTPGAKYMCLDIKKKIDDMPQIF